MIRALCHLILTLKYLLKLRMRIVIGILLLLGVAITYGTSVTPTTPSYPVPTTPTSCANCCLQKNLNAPVAIVLNSQSVNDQNIGDKCFVDLHIKCDPYYQYRYINGCCNNLQNPTWGMAENAIVRLLPAAYADNVNEIRKSVDNVNRLPSPRVISRDFITDNREATDQFTVAFMIMTQLTAHDIMQLSIRTPKPNACCKEHTERITTPDSSCAMITVPTKDRFYEQFQVKCMEIFRGKTVQENGCTIKPTEHISVTTPFLDASFIYGNNVKQTESLRSFTYGQLQYMLIKGRMFLPKVTKNLSNICFVDPQTNICFMSGDIRINQHPQLVLAQTLFFRLHNQICYELYKLHPKWADNRLFQEARKIVIAIWQNIMYGVPMEALFGPDCAKSYGLPPKNPKGFECTYNPNINPTMISEFENMAFRCLHSTINKTMNLYNEDRTIHSSFNISDWFNQPALLVNESFTYDKMVIGLATQKMEMFDRFFSDAVTNFLLKRNDAPYGDDLAAIDLMRARECGIADYLLVSTLAGYSINATWEDLIERMGADVVSRLKAAYKNQIRDIDAAIGCLLEKPCGSSMTGKTLQAIMGEMFIRLKDGDRMWFLCESAKFNLNQLNAIRSTSMAFVFCYASDNIQSMQRDAFRPPNKDTNPLVPCKTIVDEFLTQLRQYW